MAFTIVLGLTILSVANYGNAYEFPGLNPSAPNKGQLKPTVKPLSTVPNQPQQGNLVKQSFGYKNAPTKSSSFGAPPFDPYKASYQPYQPGPFPANYQPFGPYPGYPGPVVYPGPGHYQGPSVYPPQPEYRFESSDHKPFGFQPFSGQAQSAFGPFKFGPPPKKYNKNAQGLVDFQLPGKYFPEHQFGTYHGPEFSSAIVPAEHNVKQTKPKDALPEKQALPALHEFGFSKQSVHGFAHPSSFGYPVPNFPPIQPFFSTEHSVVKSVPTTIGQVPSIDVKDSQVSDDAVSVTATPVVDSTVSQKSNEETVAVTTESVPSSSEDESATSQPSAEVTGEPSATPAADPQPTSQSQEEVTAGGAVASEVATDNEASAPAADDTTAKQQSEQSSTTEASEPLVVAGDVDATNPPGADVIDFRIPNFGGPEPIVSDPAVSTTVGPSEVVKSENKPVAVEFSAAAVSSSGLPNEFFGSVGAVPVSSNPSSLSGLFEYPYFGQSADFQQPSYFPQYDAPKLSEEELKAFAEFAELRVPQTTQVLGDVKNAAVKIESRTSSTPLPVQSAEKSEKVSSGDSKETAQKDAPVVTKKTDSVQIIANDPFNGQLPLLYDPTNTRQPLDTYSFYNHPAVSRLSSQASLASYSPEDAFSSFGSQFRQGYLIGSVPQPAPVALPKTIVQSGQLPISISSKEHPLHSQIFQYSQSFVPYPETAAFRSAGIPSTATPVSVVSSTTAEPAADSATSTSTAATA